MNNFIKWCKCERMILTSGQIRDGQDCMICQKEHAESFNARMETQQEDKNDRSN